MSLTMESMSPADIAAVTGNSGNGGNGGWGDNNGWWVILLLLALGRGFGYGGNDGGQGGGGSGSYAQPIVIDSGRSGGCGCCEPCATQSDVRSAVDQQTIVRKLDEQTYGIADSTYALNNAITGGFAGVQQTLCQGFNGINTSMLQGFHGVDNAVCNLGYNIQAGFNGISREMADCCCDTRAAIKDVGIGVERAGWSLSRQISDCCCDLEKMNMQNRFDAQAYNCNTLQAIDKLGDRIIDYMTKDKIATLTAENQSLRFAASQANQNAFITANQEAQTAELIRRLGRDNPVPAYVVPNPNCCYQYNVQPVNNCGCNTGCGGF